MNLLKGIAEIFRRIFGKDIEIFNIIMSRQSDNLFFNREYFSISKAGKFTHLHSPFRIINLEVGDYTYTSPNSTIHKTVIGKFCSIGPNFISGNR